MPRAQANDAVPTDKRMAEMAKALSSLMENGGSNGGPWWTRSLQQFGPVIVILAVLLGVVLGWIPSKLDGIQPLRDELRMHSTAVETGQKEQLKSTSDMRRLLQVICRNTAKTDYAKDACDR